MFYYTFEQVEGKTYWLNSEGSQFETTVLNISLSNNQKQLQKPRISHFFATQDIHSCLKSPVQDKLKIMCFSQECKECVR